MMNFEFATAGRLLFGAGTVRQVPEALEKIGRRPLLVVGGDRRRSAPVSMGLHERGINVVVVSVTGEPTTDLVVDGARVAVNNDCDSVIGMGGGSVIDAAKAIAALITNRDDIMTYLEVIGDGRPLTSAPVPWIAVPTTAGTGAEVTKNAVLTSREHRVKVSLRHPQMLPQLAVIDPELTVSMPPAVTASTGLDALTQVLEPYVSIQANPLTDALCREGLKRAGRSLQAAYERGEDLNAREDMAIASLFGGLALANAKLGAIHGFAAVIGGLLEAPHGFVCAGLLPHVVSANLAALRRRGPGHLLFRYETAARLLCGNPQASAEDGVVWLKKKCQNLRVPGLAEYGLQQGHFSEIVRRAQQTSSIKGNPVQLTAEEMRDILSQAVTGGRKTDG